MDLKKQVELYFGQHPFRGDAALMQRSLAAENDSFCAVFVRNDVPALTHAITGNTLTRGMGCDTPFAKQRGSYVRPVAINLDSGLATVPSFSLLKDPDSKIIPASTLVEAGLGIGGVFFYEGIAQEVLAALTGELGYEVLRKYR